MTASHSTTTSFPRSWTRTKPFKAQGFEAIIIAEVIFSAATDGEDRLRYPAGQDFIDKVAKRRANGDEVFLADMRHQFRVRRELHPTT